MQPAISASHLLRGPIFTHLTYPESSKKKITAKVHIGREEYTLHIYRPLTQKHLDVLLAIIESAKRAVETPDGGLVVEFTGHGVLKALGERHAKNHAWLWTMIRQMQSCLITVINADGRKIRFPLIASSGFTPDSSEFRTVHHAGVTAGASYYHVRFSGEMMAFVGNDIHVHLPPSVLESVLHMKSLVLKYFVWRCMTATRRRGPLGRVINQILPADASKFARCRMRRMVVKNREMLKALGIHVEPRGGDYYLEWSAKASKVFFQMPAKSKQSAFSQAYDAMLYQRTMARSVQASEPRVAAEPSRPPVAAESSKPVAQAKPPEAAQQIAVGQAKVDPPQPPVAAEPSRPVAQAELPEREAPVEVCEAPERLVGTDSSRLPVAAQSSEPTASVEQSEAEAQSEPRAASEPSRPPVAAEPPKPVAQAKPPEAAQQIVIEQAKVDPPQPPVAAEPSKPAASAKNPKAEVHCTASKAPEGHATAVCLPVELSGCSISAIGAGPQEGGLETDRNAQVCVGGSGTFC